MVSTGLPRSPIPERSLVSRPCNPCHWGKIQGVYGVWERAADEPCRRRASMISRGKLFSQEKKRKSWHGPSFFACQFMREQVFRAEVLTPFGGTAVAAMEKRCNRSCQGVTS